MIKVFSSMGESLLSKLDKHPAPGELLWDPNERGPVHFYELSMKIPLSGDHIAVHVWKGDLKVWFTLSFVHFCHFVFSNMTVICLLKQKGKCNMGMNFDLDFILVALLDCPVLGFAKFSGYEDKHMVPFHRPELHITFDGDEVSRTVAKRKANYDMDSKQFNYKFFSGNGHR
ncbi:hypothetical protein COLO4_19628 [Corchorus olitorius]|uniref:Uncharacterized protein n=1 Tax=Corchorus olitorius TaxID=93759 RepID=A0A1R3J4F5_9ROSI|nr:hypothetical protein COLO4_19628 [Corchorus olitorius]